MFLGIFHVPIHNELAKRPCRVGLLYVAFYGLWNRNQVIFRVFMGVSPQIQGVPGF